MMFFPLGYLQMESTKDMGHPGWNQDLTPRTAVIVAGTMDKVQPACQEEWKMCRKEK
jgi:hypothetical protein